MKNTLYTRIASTPTKPRRPALIWSILRTTPAYSNTTEKSTFYLHEKLDILMYPDQEELLNKRSENLPRCPHQRKSLLSNYDSKD